MSPQAERNKIVLKHTPSKFDDKFKSKNMTGKTNWHSSFVLLARDKLRRPYEYTSAKSILKKNY